MGRAGPETPLKHARCEDKAGLQLQRVHSEPIRTTTDAVAFCRLQNDAPRATPEVNEGVTRAEPRQSEEWVDVTVWRFRDDARSQATLRRLQPFARSSHRNDLDSGNKHRACIAASTRQS